MVIKRTTLESINERGNLPRVFNYLSKQIPRVSRANALVQLNSQLIDPIVTQKVSVDRAQLQKAHELQDLLLERKFELDNLAIPDALQQKEDETAPYIIQVFAKEGPNNISGGGQGEIECADLRLGGLSLTGSKEKNEDALLVLRLPDGRVILAVADGVTANLNGEKASQLAIDTLEEASLANIGPLAEYFSAAEKAIAAEKAKGANADMSTTLVAALIEGRRLQIGSVGDSRAYLARNGRLLLLTPDQSVAHNIVVDKLKKEGLELVFPLMSPELSRRYYEEINLTRSHKLIRALGQANAVPFLHELELEEDDVLLLGSDGINPVPWEELEKATSEPSAGKIAGKIKERLGVPGDNASIGILFNAPAGTGAAARASQPPIESLPPASAEDSAANTVGFIPREKAAEPGEEATGFYDRQTPPPPPAAADQSEETGIIPPAKLTASLTEAGSEGSPLSLQQDKTGNLTSEYGALQAEQTNTLAEINYRTGKTARLQEEIDFALKAIDQDKRAFQPALKDAARARKTVWEKPEVKELFQRWQHKRINTPQAYDERELTYEELKGKVKRAYSELNGVLNRMNKELELPDRMVKISNKRMQITALGNEITALRKKSVQLSAAIAQKRLQLEEHQASIRSQIDRIRKELLDPLTELEDMLAAALNGNHK
jgi:serine/threonine protein phosphatase PrpC